MTDIADPPDPTAISPIPPHGDLLIDRTLTEADSRDLHALAAGLPSLTLQPRELNDLDLIAVGALSPLTGFITRPDYEAVLKDMRLANGVLWPLPVTLSAPPMLAEKLSTGDRLALRDSAGELRGVIDVADIYRRNHEREARAVYLTADHDHPGVATLYHQHDFLIGGPVLVPARPDPYGGDHLLPTAARARFLELGWRTIVAFQTRNPIHRAHEHLLHVALESADGLFINPLVGETNPDDVPAGVRMNCYRAVIDNYFPADRVVLGVLPAAMRYAGPREALFHAIIRQNYGCTHFIVGRDHAGVGDYYGPFDAQRIFDGLSPTDLAIRSVPFDFAFYCRSCGRTATAADCPHDDSDHVFLSGTRVRELLHAGAPLPPEFTRPEVAEILQRAYSS
jgi:sulfate adenylyltransferase